jgi:restriction system protein
MLAGTPLPATVFKGMFAGGRALYGCDSCGWWTASHLDAEAPHATHDGGFAYLRQTAGVLKELDVVDLSTPVQELRAYLLGKYGDRFAVHPKKYEEIVGSVFSDFGFRIRVTSFSGDEGIDVFVFDGPDNGVAAIQVKRQRGAVSAEQIRAFVGALVLRGLTSGIYVTTSSYQPGATLTAAKSAERLGVGIDLVDASHFYEALHLTTRVAHLDPEDPSAPYFRSWHAMDKAPLIWGSSW